MGNVKEQNINSIIKKFNKFKNDLISNSTFKACNRCGYLKLKPNTLNVKKILILGVSSFAGYTFSAYKK